MANTDHDISMHTSRVTQDIKLNSKYNTSSSAMAERPRELDQ